MLMMIVKQQKKMDQKANLLLEVIKKEKQKENLKGKRKGKRKGNLKGKRKENINYAEHISHVCVGTIVNCCA